MKLSAKLGSMKARNGLSFFFLFKCEAFHLSLAALFWLPSFSLFQARVFFLSSRANFVSVREGEGL